MPLLEVNQESAIGHLLKQRIRLCSVAWNVLRDRQQAEDLFQDTVVKAVRRLETFEDEDHLTSWAVVTIRNAAIDAMRQRETRAAILSELALEKLDQYRAAQAKLDSDSDRLDALTLCAEKLPSKSRDLLHQRYALGKSGAELANDMQLSKDAIFKRLSRIHQLLRECVTQKLRTMTS
ncbi:MAG: sigma-70 family RNA polymerase sigma factor [Verrucomicrobiota bacterium]